MSAALFLGICAVGGIVGYISWHYSEEEKIKRAMKEAMRWPIAELPENTHGRIVGKARAIDETLSSPVTGRPCVYYVVQVIEGAGKSAQLLLREELGVPFMIEDRSGRAIIDPQDCRILLDFDGETESGPSDDPTPAEEALLARHGKNSKGWFMNKALRYTESAIEVGETVAVLGSGVREPDPDAEPSAMYRGAPVTRLRLTSSARYPLIISDHGSTTDD